MNHLLDQILMGEIMQSARAAASYIRGMTLEDFRADVRTQDAVIRRLEVMGEAAGRVSTELQRAHPQIPWAEMTKLRHDLIHQYETVQTELLWRTLQEIPALMAKAEPILADTPL